MTYFKISTPASPNFRAATLMMGSMIMAIMGVQILQATGKFALMAMNVARKAYEAYRTGATPRDMSIFHVARTSRPATFTLDAAKASDKNAFSLSFK